MEDPIKISTLNDFIFCPASIYFHNLYEDIEEVTYQSHYQINGRFVHQAVDNKNYSSKKAVLQSLDVYCERFNIIGKIDVFDIDSGILTERKKKIVKLYDGYYFQLYAQYFSLIEMGYNVKKIRFHSFDDNKNYYVNLPVDGDPMFEKFKSTINEMRNFNMNNFTQTNVEKCKKCIYINYCDRTLEC